jgi:hypothetical protein
MCNEYKEPSLDILSHIHNRSLALIDYRLNPGQCEGLYRACLADEELLKNIVIENCGITDQMLAKIVSGLDS